MSQKSEVNRRINVLLMCPHEAHLDPRISWWTDNTSSMWNVFVVETSETVGELEAVDDERQLITANSRKRAYKTLPYAAFNLPDSSEELELLGSISAEYDRLRNSGASTTEHALLLKHFVNQSVALINAALRVKGADVLIVVDLPSLLAGVYISRNYSIPLLYDAQEIWAYSNLDLNDGEAEWWNNLERRLLKDVDVPITVSPGIAEWYGTNLQREMIVVPNFVPKTPIKKKSDALEGGPVRFIYLGVFAKGRGIKNLITAWDCEPDIATLTLQGPDTEYRRECMQLAKSLKRGKRGAQFASPVSEDRLISVASEYHVGIIPYTYSYPYDHCSPNKLSQYMVAGCAILSNELHFVSECIGQAECGMSADFKSVDKIRDAVATILDDKSRIERWKENSSKAAFEVFNWESVSVGVVDKVNAILPDTGGSSFAISEPLLNRVPRLSSKKWIYDYYDVVKRINYYVKDQALLLRVAKCFHRNIKSVFGIK